MNPSADLPQLTKVVYHSPSLSLRKWQTRLESHGFTLREVSSLEAVEPAADALNVILVDDMPAGEKGLPLSPPLSPQRRTCGDTLPSGPDSLPERHLAIGKPGGINIIISNGCARATGRPSGSPGGFRRPGERGSIGAGREGGG